MSTDLEHIEEVRVVRVQPGDVIWLRAERHLTADMAERIREQAKRAWPDNEIMVGSEIDIAVMRPEAESQFPRPLMQEIGKPA